MVKKFALLLLTIVVIIGFWHRNKVKQEAKIEDPIEPTVSLKDLAKQFLTPNPLPTTMPNEWQRINSYTEMRGVTYQYNGNTYDIQVVKIDPKQVKVSLEYDQQGKTVSQWAQNRGDIIIANAGFFKEKNEPVGLLYIDGKRIDSHRVNPVNTGLLQINSSGIEILNLANTVLPEESLIPNALQTYPILIDRGRVVANKTLVKQDRRTAIGVDADKNIFLITAKYPHLGLYEFANTLQISDLKLQMVLNLDGGGSTGITIHSGDFHSITESVTAVPTVLVVEKK